MIKLIMSDIDGTLTPEGSNQVNPEIFDEVRRLREKGIRFVAASGRNFESMRAALAPIADEITCVGCNGAEIVVNGKTEKIFTIDDETAQGVKEYFREKFPDCFLGVGSSDGFHTDSRDEKVNRWISEGYGIAVISHEDLLKVNIPAVKVCLLLKEGDAAIESIPVAEKFGDKVHALAAGDKWVDVLPPNIDKGTALRYIQNEMGITPEETMAFGDNGNDIGMLKQAAYSYAAPGARPEVSEVARTQLVGDLWDCVLNELKKL